MQIPQPVAQFKVVLLGDDGVGKTTFVNKHITKQFQKCYTNSQGFNVYSLTFSTNHGPIKLNIWDTAGRQKTGTLREGYYLGSNAAILMFDVTTRITYRNVPLWYKDLTRVIDNIPIVLVGNKVDKQNLKVKPKQITFNRKWNLQYFNVSTKSNFQIEKPLLWILRSLLGDPKLFFVQQLALKPTEIEVEVDEIKILEKKWMTAHEDELPFDNQDFIE